MVLIVQMYTFAFWDYVDCIKKSCDSCANETIWPQLFKGWITGAGEKKSLFLGQLQPIPIRLSSG